MMTAIDFSHDTLISWLDKWGLVKTAQANTDSGNGVLYTSVFIALLAELSLPSDEKEMDHEWYVQKLTPCFKKPGLLMRNPANTFGQEEFDDYLGVAMACIILGERSIPRKIIWYGVLHLGFYNNLNDFSWNAWLWRFIQVWPLMWCAAFPFLKYPLWPILAIISHFTNPTAGDANGIQLAWCYEVACKYLGFNFKYGNTTEFLPIAFASYYEVNHPFIFAANSLALKESVKNGL